MTNKIVRTLADVEKLVVGDSVIIEVPGLPEDPIELLESDAYKTVLELEEAVRNVKPENGPENDSGDEGSTQDHTVVRDGDYVVITPGSDGPFVVDGDVRKSNSFFITGKQIRKKLQKNRDGFVTIGEIEYPYSL